MGNTSSSKASHQTQQQLDIAYLGERYPFGDEELKRLYQLFFLIEQCDNRKSFLEDWVLHSGSYASVDQSLPMEIFPQDFSRDLERSAFLRPDQEQYIASSASKASSPDSSPEQKEKPTSSRCCPPVKNQIVPDRAELDNLIIPQDENRLDRLEAFLNGVANSGRRGGRAALTVIYNYARLRRGTDEVDPLELMEVLYRLACATHLLKFGGTLPTLPEKDKTLLAMACSVKAFSEKQHNRYGYTAVQLSNDGLQAFLEWSEATAPLLASIQSTFMHQVLWPDKPYPPSRTPFVFPQLGATSGFFASQFSTKLFCFCSMSASLGGAWHRLYTSESDGLSFNRLQLALLGYGGPTLMIIRSTSSGVFGAFTSCKWKETRDFYGNSNCFLYRLEPEVAVYRPTSGSNYMYCNSTARSKGYDGLAHGIGFGGTADEPRLFLNESLEECLALPNDLTFEPGMLLPPAPEGLTSRQACTFEIDILEVWGVGGDDVVNLALETRKNQREVTAANIQKARKVDKAAFLEDFQTGLIDSKAFKHRDQVRGRASLIVDNEHENAYKYEK